MPTAPLAVELIRAAVVACAMTHPVVRDPFPGFVDQVVAEAEGENHRQPFAVGVNEDRKRGLPAVGKFLDSAAEAAAFTEQMLEDNRSVDVGPLAVNLRAHPDAFATIADAFVPEKNVCAGAVILAEDYRAATTRAARCLYNTGRPTCSNGYPEIIAAAERRVLNEDDTAGPARVVAPPPPPEPPPPMGTAFQRALPPSRRQTLTGNEAPASGSAFRLKGSIHD